MCNTSLKDMFENSFARWGEKPAITFFRHGDIETTLTYGQLELEANQLTHALHESGVAKGERANFFMEKSLMAVVSHIALQKLGAVAVPLNPGFRKAEMLYLLNDADAVLEVRIVDPVSFDDVRTGQTGELWLQGPVISPGYWRKLEKTKATFVDGWFRTGDLGRVMEMPQKSDFRQ